MTWLDEMKARLEAATSLSSDDFGHDTHKLLIAESDELQVVGANLTKAIRIIEIYEKALDQVLDITCNTAAALAEAEKIKGEK